MKRDEARYLQLQQDLGPFQKALAQAVDTTLNEGVSSYPILVLHKGQLALGIALVDAVQADSPWSVNLTTLEELVTKKVIGQEKVSAFQQVYKDPRAYFCLFVLEGHAAEFVFFPRPTEVDAD